MKAKLLAVLMVAGLVAPGVALAAAPLALPAYEIVSISAASEQKTGFAAGDVQATVGFSGAAPTPTPGTAPWNLVPTTPAAPAGLFTEGGEDMPGLKELGDASEASGNPRAFLPMIFAFLIALLCGFAVFGATHNSRMGQRGSLFLQSVTSLIVMIFFYVGGGGVIPGWVLIPFGVEALFFLIQRNPQSQQI